MIEISPKCNLLLFMRWVVYYSGRQSVKADHIRDDIGFFYNVSIDNIVPRQKPIAKLFVGVYRNHFVIAQIL